MLDSFELHHSIALLYSRTCLERPLHWAYKSGLFGQVVFGDRFNYIELQDLLPGIPGLPKQVVSHGSGLLRQVSLYILYCIILYMYMHQIESA